MNAVAQVLNARETAAEFLVYVLLQILPYKKKEYDNMNEKKMEDEKDERFCFAVQLQLFLLSSAMSRIFLLLPEAFGRQKITLPLPGARVEIQQQNVNSVYFH